MKDSSQLLSIFCEARERRSAEERAAYLDEACRDDAELRARVEQLLRAEPEIGNFLKGDASQPSPAATVDDPITERPGKVIGPYKLLQRLGEGGMGVVWVAEQTEPVKRRVALKVIKPGMDSAQVIARFEQERQALALMDHPNIARVLDAGSTDAGRPYFVMEMVKGIPITKFCDQEHLTPRERLELFIPICHAVQHAHQKGVIHRDLKPSNVIIALYDGKPVPKVIDFGVAKATSQKLTERTVFTEVGQMVGTLEYMAPEQAELNNLDIDTRADIYALGVILYELLTGGPPFTGQELRSLAFTEMLRMIREVEPQKPSTRLSSSEQLASIAAKRKLEPAKLTKLVSGELDWIVMKALEKDRSRRYDTANGLALEILRYLNDEPVLVRPPGAGYRMRKFVRRHPASTALAVVSLVAALAVVGVIVGLVYNGRLVTANARIESANSDLGKALEEVGNQRAVADAQRAYAKGQEALARRYLYATQMGLAERAVRDHRTDRLLELLDEQRPLSGEQEDLRGFEWHYLRRAYPRSLFTLRGHTESVTSVTFRADGQVMASASSDKTVRLWNMATGREIRTFGAHAERVEGVAPSPDGKRLASSKNVIWADIPPSVALSPDGKRLASGTSKVMKVWDTTTGEELFTLRKAGQCAAFSPDGRHIASSGQDNAAKVWDAATGRLVRSLQTSSGVGSLAFSPDGKLLAAGLLGGRVTIWDAATGREVRTTAEEEGSMYGVAFSPDGKRFAGASYEKVVKVWDATTGQVLLSLCGHKDGVTAVAFSPDGKRLASVSFDKTLKMWDTGTGKELFSLSEGCNIRGVAFSSTGLLAAGGDDRVVKVWDARIGPATPVFQSKGRCNNVGFSPDGRRLAATCGGQLRVWDAATGQVTLQLQGLSGNGRATFSSDGKLLAGENYPYGTVTIWDAVSGAAVRVLKGRGDEVFGTAFSPDGKLIATAHLDKTVRVWNAATGQELRTLEGQMDPAIGVAFSPDGKWLAAGSFQDVQPGQKTFAVRVWTAATGRQAFTFDGLPHSAFTVKFSPDGKQLAAACGNYGGDIDGEVRVWDTTTGREVFTLKGHKDCVWSVAFSPDSKRLASASGHVFDGLEAPGEVKLWDLATGHEVLTLHGHVGAIYGVAFSPNGKLLATAGEDGVRIWDGTPLAETPPYQPLSDEP